MNLYGNKTNQSRFVAVAFAILCASFAAACGERPADNSKNDPSRIRIGLSMDTLKEERWQRDRDQFVERAKELGAEVLVQSADGNDNVQTHQAESLLTQ